MDIHHDFWIKLLVNSLIKKFKKRVTIRKISNLGVHIAQYLVSLQELRLCLQQLKNTQKHIPNFFFPFSFTGLFHFVPNILSGIVASQSNTNACHSSGYSLFQLLLSVKTSLLEYLASHKAFMIFHYNAPNSHVPAFLQFLVNAFSATSHIRSAKYTPVKAILHIKKIPFIHC